MIRLWRQASYLVRCCNRRGRQHLTECKGDSSGKPAAGNVMRRDTREDVRELRAQSGAGRLRFRSVQSVHRGHGLSTTVCGCGRGLAPPERALQARALCGCVARSYAHNLKEESRERVSRSTVGTGWEHRGRSTRASRMPPSSMGLSDGCRIRGSSHEHCLNTTSCSGAMMAGEWAQEDAARSSPWPRPTTKFRQASASASCTDGKQRPQIRKAFQSDSAPSWMPK